MGATTWLCVEEEDFYSWRPLWRRAIQNQYKLLPASIAKHHLQKRGEMSADISYNFMR